MLSEEVTVHVKDRDGETSRSGMGGEPPARHYSEGALGPWPGEALHTYTPNAAGTEGKHS